MQRYFVSSENMSHNQVTITGTDAAHIVRVMRGKEGQLIAASNGQGRDVIARIIELAPDSVLAEIVEEVHHRIKYTKLKRSGSQSNQNCVSSTLM